MGGTGEEGKSGERERAPAGRSGAAGTGGGVAMVVGCAVCYVLGTIWFMTLTGADLASALGWCVLPYLPGDVIKIALAAILTIQLDKRMPNI